MDSIASILNIKQDYPISAIPTRPIVNDPPMPQPDGIITEAVEPKKPDQSSSDQKIDMESIKRSIHSIKDQLDGLIRALDGLSAPMSGNNGNSTDSNLFTIQSGEKILEGVFNGEKMIGSDGAEYSIPPNYASKSKLVEGDIMKLTITRNGSFIYKQIKPIERKKIIAVLEYDIDKKKWSAMHEDHRYKILTASISFYKGKAGDEVIIIVPEHSRSDWGAVDNIISK